ncbi:MAG: lactonase family protein [Chloroflexales bacterium]|nr:lactonase family protein [Chloroflexales bacterium]
MSRQILFVGSYADADQAGIHIFAFDTTTAALTKRGEFTGLANPSFLALHPNGRWLYAVSEVGQQSHGAPGAIGALQLDPAAGHMMALNQQPSGGDWPCHLRIDTTGRWLFASNYGSGSVSVLPIRDDGSLGALTDRVQHHGSSVNAARQEGPHAHTATIAPDNRFVLVTDLGIDKVLIYAFDSAAGQMSLHSHADTRPGAGPRHAVFHPNGQHLYVANELDSTVSVYRYAATGALREIQTLRTLPDDAPENTVADIHVAPSGDRLYVSNRGHNSLAVFDVGADGELILVTIAPCGGNWPRNFALAPGGRWALAANQHSDQVTVLPLGGAAAVGAAVAHAAVPQASCVVFANP